jgi:chromosome segregation protein
MVFFPDEGMAGVWRALRGALTLLKLKKLELVGFKSFCDRQELPFNGGGVSAVVGPNGCGKSNISDSISWVLGERSAKTLRGSRMQDVIFNGSQDRKPSGLASVSLTLLDPDAYLAAKSESGKNGVSHAIVRKRGEITVTRKLFRSGESQYLLNGKICRLRDIQDIFMGTGLGPEHYAIIEQGRVGQILSSRPIDRRGMIEEAAGVTRFKSKKRLAEFKLESAKQNLHRVNDILQEVIRQVNSLKRQASRARRYDELKKQRDENLSVLLAGRFHDLDRRLKAADAEMQTVSEEFSGIAREVAELQSELDANRQQEQNDERILEEKRTELSQLTVEIERLRSRVEQQTRTAEETALRKQQAEAEIVQLELRLGEMEEHLVVEEAAMQEISGQAETIRQGLSEKTTELEKRQSTLREGEHEQERLRLRVLQLLGESTTLKNQLAKLEEFLAGNERNIARITEERSAAAAELEEMTQARRAIEEQVESRQADLDSLTEQRKEIQSRIEQMREQARLRRDEADRLRNDLSRLRARSESLEEILSHHAYTTEAVKDLFAAVESRPPEGFRPIGILADFVDVDREFEKATEEFLREELEYVVVQSWDEAHAGVGLLRSDLQGYATFLVHPESAVPPEPAALGPETGVTGRLADHVRPARPRRCCRACAPAIWCRTKRPPSAWPCGTPTCTFCCRTGCASAASRSAAARRRPPVRWP